MTGNDNFHKEIIQWASTYLESHRYTLKSTLPKNVQDTPWSYVIRFVTTEGGIYLKHTPEQLALEASITQTLHDQFHASVPEIIIHNAELNCFLMKDAGQPLREILKKQFDTALLCKAIDQFTSMQVAIADHINIFLDIGVPDWRLDKLPDLYKQLLAQKDLLTADGLTEAELDTLKAQQTKLATLCKKLSDHAIKPSMVQCDFHDNNILIETNSQKITFIDLGEIVISHPFFSLIGCLRQVKRHHSLTERDDAYLQLLDACFKNYRNLESPQQLSDAFAIAQILWCMYEALAQYRLMLACDQTRFKSFQRHGKLRDALKELISACSAKAHPPSTLFAL